MEALPANTMTTDVQPLDSEEVLEQQIRSSMSAYHPLDINFSSPQFPIKERQCTFSILVNYYDDVLKVTLNAHCDNHIYHTVIEY